MDVDRVLHPRGPDRFAHVTESLQRRLALSPELIRAYSRRGNFHTEPDTAEALGLPGLVAQGTQVCGPAYAALLDVWGADFLDHGELDVRFVGMAVDFDELVAVVEITGADASIAVANETAGCSAAVGTARRRA